MEPEVEIQDNKEYSCPANFSHKLYGEDNLLKHIMRCKDFEGKKFWCCKYQWTHMFNFHEERDHHEQRCEFKRPDVERYKDFFYLNPRKESPEKVHEKRQNIANSRVYYEKNKLQLEYEKNLRRKIREKKQKEEAEKMSEVQRSQRQLLENNQYYAKEYLLENSVYLVTEWGHFFLVQIANGDRKLEKKNFEMKVSIDLGKKLDSISRLEYSKILGGELIAHPEYPAYFDKLKTIVDTEHSIACWDYCDTNDELVVLTTSKHVPHLPENRVAILVMRKSRFLSGERPFHIPENNVSNVFVNEYDQFLETEMQTEKKGFEDKNSENTTAIVTYEYKQQIEKKLKSIIELIQESLSLQNNAELLKRENEQLQKLFEEKENLKSHERKLTEREEQIKGQIDEYKRELKQAFLDAVHSKQESLNHQINLFYNSKLKELDKFDQAMAKLEEDEGECLRVLKDGKAELEVLHKNRKTKESQITRLEQQIAEKKKTIHVTKSLALTNVLDSLCHICQQNRINILYFPCYHFYVCEECQKRASEVGRHECLYCLKSVEKVIRVIV